MKRYIPLACIALVIVTCMVSPVSAADMNSEYFDLMDYTTVDSNGNFFYFSGSKTISLSLPGVTVLYYVDLLFTGDGVTSIDVLWGDIVSPLTIVSVGNSIYRAYGSISPQNYAQLSLNFKNTGSYSYLTLLSCKVSTLSISTFDSECYCAIGTVDYDRSIHYVPSDEINYRSFQGTDDYLFASYNLSIYNLDWRKYDFVDFLIFTTVDSISSINCTMGGLDVPFTVSFIDNDSMTTHDFMYSIRVDCRNLDRSLNDYPMVTVTGNVITGQANLVSVLSCVGVISQNYDVEASLLRRIINVITLNFSQLNSWIASQTYSIQFTLDAHFGNLFSWLSDQTAAIVSAIRGDTTPGNAFQQQVNQKDQLLNDMAAVMDSVDQPDLNSVNVSADTYVDSTVLAASLSGITTVFSQGLYLNLIVMSIMMATAGYVLFGKR